MVTKEDIIQTAQKLGESGVRVFDAEQIGSGAFAGGIWLIKWWKNGKKLKGTITEHDLGLYWGGF